MPFCSVQFSRSVMSEYCNPMNHSTPGLPLHHQLLEFTQTHVHRVSNAIQPSHPLPSPSPPAPNPSQHPNQSILKEISPGISLEGMMLKLKLQYFGHLMRRVDSLEIYIYIYINIWTILKSFTEFVTILFPFFFLCFDLLAMRHVGFLAL